MTARRIENEEYREALGTISALIDLDPAPGSSDSDRLVALVQLIEQYEAPFAQEFHCASRRHLPPTQQQKDIMTLARDKTQMLLEATGFQEQSVGIMGIGDNLTGNLVLNGKMEFPYGLGHRRPAAFNKCAEHTTGEIDSRSGGADPRRRRIYERIRCRAILSRRPIVPDLRRDEPGAATRHCQKHASGSGKRIETSRDATSSRGDGVVGSGYPAHG